MSVVNISNVSMRSWKTKKYKYISSSIKTTKLNQLRDVGKGYLMVHFFSYPYFFF